MLGVVGANLARDCAVRASAVAERLAEEVDGKELCRDEEPEIREVAGGRPGRERRRS